MSNIVQISDFKGFYYIANNSACDENLQYYIDKYENYYLCELMGTELKDAFIADLVDGVPQDADYLKIYNSFCEVLTGCNYQSELMHSQGLKEALTGLIYYHYISNEQYKSSLTGMVKNMNENSELLDALNVERVAEKRFNESVESFNAIGYKINELDLYSDSVKLDYKFLDIV